MGRQPITLLYDGECPFCRHEVEWLQRRDRHKRLGLVDIADEAFDPGRFGLTTEEVNGALHAVRGDGTVVRGMDAVAEAYGAVGLGWLAAPTRWPVVRKVADWAYVLFARNRVRWGTMLGRGCGHACSGGRHRI